jgi:hypothetical protein
MHLFVNGREMIYLPLDIETPVGPGRRRQYFSARRGRRAVDG